MGHLGKSLAFLEDFRVSLLVGLIPNTIICRRRYLEKELQSRGEAGLDAKIRADQKAFVDQFDDFGVDVTRMMVLARTSRMHE